MHEQDWEKFGQWHALLDALCDSNGHIDNSALASQLCHRSGKAAREDFNVAEKNLRNWRAGRHLPLRRNFVILAELLGVSGDPVLLRQWNLLYAAARGRDLPDSGKITPVIPRPSDADKRHAGRKRSALLGAALVTVIISVIAMRWMLTDPHRDLPVIGYDARVVMVVGESRVIHGDRGDCDGSNVPEWNYTMPRVPHSTLGIFTDGGLARKMSNYCNKVVPVRAVRFTAQSAGVEEIRLLDDFVKIFVTDPVNLVTR